MKRHRTIVLCVMLLIATCGAIGLRYYKNKNEIYSKEKVAPMLASTDATNFLNFEERLLSEDGEYYLWFCDREDTNCQYIENEYIKPMLNKLQVDYFENLLKVDFTNVPFSTDKLKNKFNVTSKLSFVKAVVKNGKITYSNALSWDDENPFTETQLKDWLYENNIWQSTYNTINSNN